MSIGASAKKSQSELIKKFRGILKKKMKGMEIVVQDLSLRGFASSRGFPVEFIIQGPDWDKLTETTSAIMDKMKTSDYVVDVNTDIQPNMPEVQIVPDRVALAKRGSLGEHRDRAAQRASGRALYHRGQHEYPKGQGIATRSSYGSWPASATSPARY